MHSCQMTNQDLSLKRCVAITSKKQVLHLESIYTYVNLKNTCIIINSKEKEFTFHTILSNFFKKHLMEISLILTLSQVRHCTELMIVPSNMSEITLRYFLCCFFLFGDDADWARIEKQIQKKKFFFLIKVVPLPFFFFPGIFNSQIYYAKEICQNTCQMQYLKTNKQKAHSQEKPWWKRKCSTSSSWLQTE